MITIIDKQNKVYSVHDISSGGETKEKIDSFIRQKQLETKRFLSKLDSDNLLFIRFNSSKESLSNTFKLYEVVKNLRNDKHFDLIVFQPDFEGGYDNSISNLKIFKDKEWEFDVKSKKWSGNYQLWDDILSDVRLK